MARINSFEEIISWQAAIDLATEIYAITNEKTFQSDFDLSRQMRRAIVSVSSNIAEGFERQTQKEFIQFLFIAKGSVGELRTQLLIARNLKYINEDKYIELNKKSIEISKLISKFITYLKSLQLDKTLKTN